MSKTNDTSNIATFEDHNTLADSELDAVSGGLNNAGVVAAILPNGRRSQMRVSITMPERT